MAAMTIQQFVGEHTERGQCRCGECADGRDGLDPTGHTVDMVFFSACKKGDPHKAEFTRLTKAFVGEFADVDPLDGKEHDYIELGGWIGDQGMAMQYMALGSMIGAFKLSTPITVFGLKPGDPLAMRAAQAGLLSVVALPA